MKPPHPDIRRRLLGEALRAFTTHGYSAACVREIVERSRVTKPTLYYYFGSKARLYQSLIAETFQGFNRELAAIAASSLSPVEKLEAITAHYLRHGRSSPESVILILMALYRCDPNAPAVDLRAHTRPGVEAVARVIAEGMRSGIFQPGEPLQLCSHLLGMIHIQLLILLKPDRRVPASSARQLVRTFVEGIGKD